MPNNQYLWLFFRFSGRLSRVAFLLTFLLMVVVVSFPLYQFMRVPAESLAGQTWSVLFGVIFVTFLWVHIATSVKRLHDMGKPGILAVSLFIPVVSIIVFLILCLFPGNPGPNQYGRYANSAQ
ncbi:DUF805 domain-containing protein [Pseudaminobacter arsenicus]|uniref:DUF805 domain-containing protein n=1 Tax=Borborobacter arsenicus TaxID=1851146 RepID=A0A432VAY5_9HYPH|nr:DUF805 domain-containing protein [Pseudaminobacter arsenicus]